MLLKSFRNPPVSATLVAAAMMACGTSHSSKQPDQREPPRVTSAISELGLKSSTDDPKLLGYWSSDCHQSQQSDQSYKLSLSVQNNLAVEVLTLYQNSLCTQAMLDLEVYSSYSVKDGEFEDVSRRYVATIRSADVAAAASQFSSCGFNAWRSQVPYDVTNLDCPQKEQGVSFSDTKAGKTYRRAYQLRDDKAFLTLTLDGIDFRQPLIPKRS